MSSSCVVKDVERQTDSELDELFLVRREKAVTGATKGQAQRSNLNQWSLSTSKRVFDFSVALVVLLVFAIPMLLVAIAVRLTSRGPAIFTQKRVGRDGRLFSIYKFRSMESAPRGRSGSGLTAAGDQRVTALGMWLRKLKLDELPQFFNILRGDMSLVGPRPKLPAFSERWTAAYRPGITGAASLAFRQEEEMLGKLKPEEVESYYHDRIKPLKARIDLRYMMRATLWSDLRLVAGTFLIVFKPAPPPKITVKSEAPGTQRTLIQMADPVGD